MFDASGGELWELGQRWFGFCEDDTLDEQTSTQANLNTKTKSKFTALAEKKGLVIPLPSGSVVHHLNDEKDADGLKDNSWPNVLIIPSLEGNSSYGELVHRIITVFSRMPEGTTIEGFFEGILNLDAHSYTEEDNEFHKTKIRDLMRR